MNTESRTPRPGTRPVAARHAFDAAALERWLGREVAGFAGPVEVLQFAGGQSNPTFLLTTPAAEYVLRKKPPGRLLATAHAIDREYRIMRALAGSGVPVPTMRAYCEDAAVIGTPFYVMDYQAGRIFTDPLLPALAPAERGAAYRDMGATLARLHALDWRALGLADFGRPERFVERQLARWSRQYEASRTDDVPAMERLGAWLAEHLPADEHAAITHGDYRIGNIIYAGDAPRIAAVLDWELSTIGHPLADLAYNCMTYHLPAGHPISAGFVGIDLAAHGIPGEDEYLATYAAASGIDPRPHWRFYMVFSLYRTAAIQQGVYARALEGNAASSTAEQFGESYRMVAAVAERLTAASP
ncbi:MAG: phosphotransferase family protein [Burkholderiaceae bacterium]|nr:phosphotransferase family protein [Burkholderiaceae bacterium]